MTPLRFSFLLPFLALFLAASPRQPSPGTNSPQPPSITATAVPVDAPIVYVSDFDLDVVPSKPAPKTSATRRSKPASTSRAPSGVPRNGPSPASEQTSSQSTDTPEAAEALKEETPADQANALVKAVSENLIRALTKAGFDARRLAANAPPPGAGVRVRGVFAEADEMNLAMNFPATRQEKSLRKSPRRLPPT